MLHNLYTAKILCLAANVAIHVLYTQQLLATRDLWYYTAVDMV